MTQRSPLISPEALLARIDDPHVRVVDVRWVLGQVGAGRRAYEAGHLPGAIFLDLDGDLALAPGPGRAGPPSAAGAGRLRPPPGGRRDRLGRPRRGLRRRRRLGRRAAVVDARRPRSSRRRGRPRRRAPGLGRRRRRAHDGRPGATRRAADPRPGRPLDERHRARRPARRGSARSSCSTRASAPRYRGEVEPIDAYPGHIPTAVNAPTDGNLVEPAGRFLAPAELRAGSRACGVGGRGRRGATRRPVVTSCGSGVSACHASLAMRVAGLPDPILYVGSYSDWSRAGEPVATGRAGPAARPD